MITRKFKTIFFRLTERENGFKEMLFENDCPLVCTTIIEAWGHFFIAYTIDITNSGDDNRF